MVIFEGLCKDTVSTKIIGTYAEVPFRNVLEEGIICSQTVRNGYGEKRDQAGREG